MVQPVEGLVVSVPVLVDAQCMERQPPHMQQKLVELCPPTRQGEAGAEGHRVADLPLFLRDVLGFAEASFDTGEALPEVLSLFVPEGKQTLRATMGLRRPQAPSADGEGATPAAKAGCRYEMLVWDLGAVAGGLGLDLDRSETVTGPWDYPPAAKFDRLLRHCRVPVGLLTNREAIRLFYATAPQPGVVEDAEGTLFEPPPTGAISRKSASRNGRDVARSPSRFDIAVAVELRSGADAREGECRRWDWNHRTKRQRQAPQRDRCPAVRPLWTSAQRTRASKRMAPCTPSQRPGPTRAWRLSSGRTAAEPTG